jgi:hypothetical protein
VFDGGNIGGYDHRFPTFIAVSLKQIDKEDDLAA